MSTNSFIARSTRDGYEGIYCHWDGYPEEPGVGWTLKNYYKSPQKVKRLIALGDLSSLQKNIGKKHDFDNYELVQAKEWTNAYHRDRGEPWKDTKPKTFKSKDALLDYVGARTFCEFVYVYEKGKWHLLKDEEIEMY